MVTSRKVFPAKKNIGKFTEAFTTWKIRKYSKNKKKYLTFIANVSKSEWCWHPQSLWINSSKACDLENILSLKKVESQG